MPVQIENNQGQNTDLADGAAIQVVNGTLYVENVNGLTIAVFADGHWRKAVRTSEAKPAGA